MSRRTRKTCPDCTAEIADSSERCRPCSRVALRKGPVRRFHQDSGYIVVTGLWDHPLALGKGRASETLEHRLVMAEHLGRALHTGESVHHKNGIKTDNRIENLELWVSGQPAGQRPCELLEWAVTIIERYADECP